MIRIVVLILALAVGAGVARADEPVAKSAPTTTRKPDPCTDREHTCRPHFWRAALEEALALSGGTLWYWIDRDRQVADWDYPSWKDRLTFQAWRYDNNGFDINFFWHPINGAEFHLIARANDFGLYGSMAFGVATSMLWEYGLEFREKISINDVLVTPGAGVSIGEPLHWLGRYLASAPVRRRWWQTALGWVFDWQLSLHDRLDGRSRALTDSSPDSLGLSSDFAHRFRLGVSTARADVEAGADDERLWPTRLELSAEIAALPGYLRPGDLHTGFTQGNLSSLELSTAVAGGEPSVGLRAETVLAGWVAQEHSRDDSGYAVVAGAALAYHYQRDDYGPWHDRLALLHFPGPLVDAHVWLGPALLRARVRGGADFAGIYAATYPGWAAAHPDAREKTILRKHGYYYGWGASVDGLLEVELPRVSAGARVTAGAWESDDGLDRSQEQVTDDIASNDRELAWKAWLRVAPLGDSLYLELRTAGARRYSALGDTRETRRWHEVGLGIGAVY